MQNSKTSLKDLRPWSTKIESRRITGFITRASIQILTHSKHDNSFRWLFSLWEHSSVDTYDLVRDISCFYPVITSALESEVCTLAAGLIELSHSTGKFMGTRVNCIGNAYIQSTVSAISSGFPSLPMGISCPELASEIHMCCN